MTLSRPDLLRLLESLRSADRVELVRSVAERMLIESEAAARIGAEWTEHTEARTAYRKGLLRLVTAVLFETHNQWSVFPRRYRPIRPGRSTSAAFCFRATAGGHRSHRLKHRLPAGIPPAAGQSGLPGPHPARLDRMRTSSRKPASSSSSTLCP